MNGAELPSGSILTVQPADLDYKRKGNKKIDKKPSSAQQRVSNKNSAANGISEHNTLETVRSNGVSATNTASKDRSNDREGQKEAEDGGEDLDDFFASLE